MELSVIDRNGKIVNKSPSWLSIDDENGEIKFESSTFYQDKYVADWSGDIQLFVSYEIESEEEDSWSWVASDPETIDFNHSFKVNIVGVCKKYGRVSRSYAYLDDGPINVLVNRPDVTRQIDLSGYFREDMIELAVMDSSCGEIEYVLLDTDLAISQYDFAEIEDS